MSYFRCGDPLDDFDRLDRLQSKREAMLPVCDKCRKRIQDESFFDIGGEILHDECARERYEQSTEDWLSDHYG